MLDPAGVAAIRILRDEHLAMASVLYGLRVAARRARDDDIAPDLRLLRAMLDYIVVFPERLHHPKESEYLFKTLAERCLSARPLIDELEAEHGRGAALIDGLQDALGQCARDGGAAFAFFAQAAEGYAEFHWHHMAKEEDVLMPLAERHLTAADWERIGAAFRENDNPLRGTRPKERVESLYRKILSLVPVMARAGVASRRASA